MARKVYVAMSGGVDSSVTAALLQQQGYEVIGVYMKNWSQDLPGLLCPWKEDYQDAKRVAVQLDIEFKIFDFETQYHQIVVNYMVTEYQAGRTPNPDIMCNQEVKFKLFLAAALQDGADLIATGHYARIKRPATNVSAELYTARDDNKDQSYFLYRVNEKALERCLMPIGELTKPEVRELARKMGLATAGKKDSQGICFVGKIGIKDFLKNYVASHPGPIINQDGQEIGQHDGAIFYTIGQRRGLQIGGGLPYYVVGKNMAHNEVHVTTQLDDKRLWQKDLLLTDTHWINESPDLQKTYWLRTRYRAPLVKAKLIKEGNQLKARLDSEVRAVAPGQSVVIYDQNRVLGGGILV